MRSIGEPLADRQLERRGFGRGSWAADRRSHRNNMEGATLCWRANAWECRGACRYAARIPSRWADDLCGGTRDELCTLPACHCYHFAD